MHSTGRCLSVLSPLTCDARIFPFIVHSPFVADICRFYFMPPPSSRSKRGKFNVQAASQVNASEQPNQCSVSACRFFVDVTIRM